MKLKEIQEDELMLEKATKVLGFLDSLKNTPLDEKSIKKIMQIQELVREVATNE